MARTTSAPIRCRSKMQSRLRPNHRLLARWNFRLSSGGRAVGRYCVMAEPNWHCAQRKGPQECVAALRPPASRWQQQRVQFRREPLCHSGKSLYSRNGA